MSVCTVWKPLCNWMAGGTGAAVLNLDQPLPVFMQNLSREKMEFRSSIPHSYSCCVQDHGDGDHPVGDCERPSVGNM